MQEIHLVLPSAVTRRLAAHEKYPVKKKQKKNEIAFS